MKRKWWLIGLGVVLAGGSASGWYYAQSDAEPAAVEAATTQVRKGTLTAAVSGTGSIEAAARETIVAVSDGEVGEVFFQEGDDVKKGDVLLTYVQEDALDQIRSSRLELERQRLELEQLQLDYKEAAEAGDGSQDEIQLNIRKQMLTIQELEDEIASLELDEGIDPIVAPIDGVLKTFDVEPGDVLREDAEIGEVVDYASMKMVVAVDELDIAEVAIGQEATVLVDALPERTYAGSVVDIAEEGTASNGVASFEVTVLLNEVDQLKPGMSAEASIVTAQKENALLLPIEAVQSFRGQYFVLVPAEASAEAEASPAPGDTEAAAGTRPSSAGTTAAGDAKAATGTRPSGTGTRAERPSGTTASTGERPADAASGTQAGASTGQRNAAGVAGAAPGSGQTRVTVEVGIANEDSIEIVSGLAEGDTVILPTTTGASGSAQTQTTGRPQTAGFGMGVVPGAGLGGSVPGAGFGGGGGRD